MTIANGIRQANLVNPAEVQIHHKTDLGGGVNVLSQNLDRERPIFHSLEELGGVQQIAQQTDFSKELVQRRAALTASPAGLIAKEYYPLGDSPRGYFEDGRVGSPNLMAFTKDFDPEAAKVVSTSILDAAEYSSYFMSGGLTAGAALMLRPGSIKNMLAATKTALTTATDIGAVALHTLKNGRELVSAAKGQLDDAMRHVLEREINASDLSKLKDPKFSAQIQQALEVRKSGLHRDLVKINEGIEHLTKNLALATSYRKSLVAAIPAAKEARRSVRFADKTEQFAADLKQLMQVKNPADDYRISFSSRQEAVKELSESHRSAEHFSNLLKRADEADMFYESEHLGFPVIRNFHLFGSNYSDNKYRAANALDKVWNLDAPDVRGTQRDLRVEVVKQFVSEVRRVNKGLDKSAARLLEMKAEVNAHRQDIKAIELATSLLKQD